MNFVTIVTFANYFDAAPVQSKLENEGIVCFLRDVHSTTINPLLANSIGGIKLDVAEKDYAAAKELLVEMGYDMSEKDDAQSALIKKIEAVIQKVPFLGSAGRLLVIIFVLLLVVALLITFFPMIMYSIFVK